jgi:hypothetical protein
MCEQWPKTSIMQLIQDHFHCLSFFYQPDKALSWSKECYFMKLELLTMASRDTVKFGSEKTVVKKEDKVIVFIMLNQFLGRHEEF